MKRLRYILTVGWMLCLCAGFCLAVSADTTIADSGAGSFRVEQIYVNVPEMDVFFYALDADGNSYTPTVVQAAGLELTVGTAHWTPVRWGRRKVPCAILSALTTAARSVPRTFNRCVVPSGS